MIKSINISVQRDLITCVLKIFQKSAFSYNFLQSCLKKSYIAAWIIARLISNWSVSMILYFSKNEIINIESSEYHL